MTIKGYKKIHIVSVGFEIPRVVQPINDLGADKVYIICKPKETGVYKEYIEEVERLIKEENPKIIIERRGANIFDIYSLMSEICDLIKFEKENKNLVFVNVSVGTRLFGAAAMISAMMFGAIPYYAEVKGYWTKDKDYYWPDGRPKGISKDVKDTIEISEFQINPPKEELIITLSLLNKTGGVSTQSELIKSLYKMDLVEDIYKEKGKSTKPKVSRNALQKFRFGYLNPLLEKKWVRKEGRRRSAKIILTDNGSNMLKIFEKVYS